MTNEAYETKFERLSDMKNHLGKELGVSEWLTITQKRINQFADATEDHQWIHINAERSAKESPYKVTIAHGFLVLSLASHFCYNTYKIDDIGMGVNYGFEKVRFINPVRAGKKIRGHFSLMDAAEKSPGQWQLKYAVKVEIEGEDKPALMAEWLTIQFI